MPTPVRTYGQGILIITNDYVRGDDALSGSGFAGSVLLLRGGHGDGVGNGGAVSITGGDPGASANAAGAGVTLIGTDSAATGTGDGGSITLQPGLAQDTGTDGLVVIDSGVADDAPLLRLDAGGTNGAITEIHTGTRDPNSAGISGVRGSLYLRNPGGGTAGSLWVNTSTTDPGTTWTNVSGGGATETLAQTLVAGNVTGGTDISVTAGDSIESASGALSIDSGGLGVDFGGDLDLTNASPTVTVGSGAGTADVNLRKANGSIANIGFVTDTGSGNAPHWLLAFDANEDIQFKRRDGTGALVDTPLRLDWTDGNTYVANTLVIDSTVADTSPVQRLDASGTNGAITEIHTGTRDPNAAGISGVRGSLYLRNPGGGTAGSLWVNTSTTDPGTTWTDVSAGAGASDWATVLAAGATNGGTNPIIEAGDAIQGTDSASGAAAASWTVRAGDNSSTGAAGSLTVRAGNSTSGNGGDLTLRSGDAGFADDPGDILIQSGENGDTFPDTGDITISTVGSGGNGDTGNITIQTGDGAGGDVPGSINIIAGASTASADGAPVNITAGDSGDGNGGSVTITTGSTTSNDNSDPAGDFIVNTGDTAGGADTNSGGGNAIFNLGASAKTGASSPGGGFTVNCGDGTGNSANSRGGAILLVAGAVTGTNAGAIGGDVTIQAGASEGAAATGGAVLIQGGSPDNDSGDTGGAVTIEAGGSNTATGATDVVGADCTISAGSGIGIGNAGGDLTLNAGDGNSAGDVFINAGDGLANASGGDIRLTAGAHAGAGVPGGLDLISTRKTTGVDAAERLNTQSGSFSGSEWQRMTVGEEVAAAGAPTVLTIPGPGVNGQNLKIRVWATCQLQTTTGRVVSQIIEQSFYRSGGTTTAMTANQNNRVATAGTPAAPANNVTLTISGSNVNIVCTGDSIEATNWMLKVAWQRGGMAA